MTPLASALTAPGTLVLPRAVTSSTRLLNKPLLLIPATFYTSCSLSHPLSPCPPQEQPAPAGLCGGLHWQRFRQSEEAQPQAAHPQADRPGGSRQGTRQAGDRIRPQARLAAAALEAVRQGGARPRVVQWVQRQRQPCRTKGAGRGPGRGQGRADDAGRPPGATTVQRAGRRLSLHTCHLHEVVGRTLRSAHNHHAVRRPSGSHPRTRHAQPSQGGQLCRLRDRDEGRCSVSGEQGAAGQQGS